MLTHQRVLLAYVPTCLACLRAHGPCVLMYSRANESCMLTCSRANEPYVLKCQRALHALVLTCKFVLRAHVATCLTCSRAHMATCFVWLHAHVVTCLACLAHELATCLACSRTETINSFCFLFFFFEVKLFFCPVLYWDEKSLLIKVEARRVTRNALRHNGSCKIMISQSQLGFVISLINNRHFLDVDPVKHIRSSFLQK